ncbi:WecB/TagA/CpsF family glycosyltransferase [Candidatus Parcubacteria bacterium]|nr:WecB/TagA/CpsF family glycosyltransferase [Candidatus Parcubacteria bacterium]
MDTINILGINISTLNKKQVLKKIEQFLQAGKQHQIVTPNPEFLLEAGHDEEFFYILNKADLTVPDGIGLKFAAWAMGKNIHRVTGADLVTDILKVAQDRKLKVAILNWCDGLSKKEDIDNAVKKLYPKLNFIIKDIDKEIGNCLPARPWQAGKLEIGSLVKFKPDILFVALGAPWQEKWIYHNLPKLPSVKIAIGVGGAFDFLTGKIKRAPKFLRVLGLEWLWRLIKQPWRWRRIYNAVIVFPWQFLKWRFILPFIYRSNVACLLYKKKNNRYKILLAERRNEPDHWQLPQGGTDGEDLMTAGARELSEEIDCDKFRPIACFSNLWKYKFDKKVGKYKTKRHIGYKGQKQGLFIAEFIGKDEDIKINFWDHSDWKWIDSKNLVNEVHPIRKESAKIFLEKFKSSTEL